MPRWPSQLPENRVSDLTLTAPDLPTFQLPPNYMAIVPSDHGGLWQCPCVGCIRGPEQALSTRRDLHEHLVAVHLNESLFPGDADTPNSGYYSTFQTHHLITPYLSTLTLARGHHATHRLARNQASSGLAVMPFPPNYVPILSVNASGLHQCPVITCSRGPQNPMTTRLAVIRHMISHHKADFEAGTLAEGDGTYQAHDLDTYAIERYRLHLEAASIDARTHPNHPQQRARATASPHAAVSRLNELRGLLKLEGVYRYFLRTSPVTGNLFAASEVTPVVVWLRDQVQGSEIERARRVAEFMALSRSLGLGTAYLGPTIGARDRGTGVEYTVDGGDGELPSPLDVDWKAMEVGFEDATTLELLQLVYEYFEGEEGSPWEDEAVGDEECLGLGREYVRQLLL